MSTQHMLELLKNDKEFRHFVYCVMDLELYDMEQRIKVETYSEGNIKFPNLQLAGLCNAFRWPFCRKQTDGSFGRDADYLFEYLPELRDYEPENFDYHLGGFWFKWSDYKRRHVMLQDAIIRTSY